MENKTCPTKFFVPGFPLNVSGRKGGGDPKKQETIFNSYEKLCCCSCFCPTPAIAFQPTLLWNLSNCPLQQKGNTESISSKTRCC